MEIVYIVLVLAASVVVVVGMFKGYNCSMKSRWIQFEAKKAVKNGKVVVN